MIRAVFPKPWLLTLNLLAPSLLTPRLLMHGLLVGISILWSITLAAQPNVGPARLLLTTQDWPPYQEYKEEKMQGLALNKVKCALGKMGQPYQITMTDWADAQLRVQNGVYHGFFSASQTEERNEYAQLSAAISQQKLNWYFGSGVPTTLDELSKLNLKFSAKFGSSKWFWLKRNGYNVVKQPRDAKVLLRLLKQREIDVILENELVFQRALTAASLPTDYFKHKQNAIQEMGVYFSHQFLKQYSGFLESFNAAIAKCEV